MLTAIIFIITIGILIFVHELGHFLTARRNGIRAEEFGFGFPPRIFGIQRYSGKKIEKVGEKEEETTEILDLKNEDETEIIQEKIVDKITEIDEVVPIKKWRVIWGPRDGDNENEAKDRKEIREHQYEKGTIYSLNLLPLGGFVKIKGEDGENKDPDSFASKGAWPRIKVLAAGVLMNFLLAWFLIAIVMILGIPEAKESEMILEGAKVQISGVVSGSPAETMGLKIGDEIVLAQKDFQIKKLEDIRNFINENRGQEITLKIKRGKENLELKGMPAEKVGENQGALGIIYSQIVMEKYPFYKAIWESLKTVLNLIWMMLSALYLILKNLATGGGGVGMEVAGPIGIAVLTGQVVSLGLVYILQFVALLSVNLGLINILPIPALDGGRILFILIEKIKGSPVSQKVEQTFHFVFFALLISLMIFITYRDILKFF